MYEMDEGYEARVAEVQALIDRVLDASDPYDGHHGNDRSPDSLAYAQETNPELASRIADKIVTDAKE